jgi:lipopolysaccharide/colanic/teichoic acid biosynthesis glycosyltransferase
MNKIVALILLILLSPVILLCCIIIFLHDFKNPIYHHIRVGKGGRLFTCYKIRTMRVVKSENIQLTTSVNDTRLFAFGKYIRQYKIDELPQLLNIVNGSMNFIGPRPNIPALVSSYNEREFFLLTVKPGLSDPSSVVFANFNNFVPDYKSVEHYYENVLRPQKFIFSRFYIENQSILLDLKIIILTLYSILFTPPQESIKKYFRVNNQ